MRSAVVLWLVFTSSTALAGEHQQLVERVLELNGIDRMCDGFVAGIRAGVQAAAERSGGPPDPQLVTAVDRVFSAEAVCRLFRARFSRAIDDRTLHAWLKWHDGELPARVTRLEAEAAGPDAVAAMKAYAAEIAAKPVAGRRRELIEELDMLTHGSEQLYASAIGGVELMMRAAATALGRPKPEPPAEQVGVTRAAIRAQVLVSYLFTYRSLADDELAAYVAFYRKSPCNETTAAFSAAMAYMIEEASRAFGKEIAASIKKVRP